MSSESIDIGIAHCMEEKNLILLHSIRPTRVAGGCATVAFCCYFISSGYFDVGL